jgi:hypothetical protein
MAKSLGIAHGILGEDSNYLHLNAFFVHVCEDHERDHLLAAK